MTAGHAARDARAGRREARAATCPVSRTGRAAGVQRPGRRPAAPPSLRPPATTPCGPAVRARAKRAWDRPLTAYYLILGGSLLITVLGLVMVYSASQIKALQISACRGSYFFRKQLLAAAHRRACCCWSPPGCRSSCTGRSPIRCSRAPSS